MARVFGIDINDIYYAGEVQFYEDIVSKLPDFIYAGFGIRCGQYENDCIIMVPHIGVFTVEVKDFGLTVNEGVLYRTNRKGFLSGPLPPYRQSAANMYGIIHELDSKFGIRPYIRAIEYMPNVHLDEEIKRLLERDGYDTNLIITGDDMVYGAGFLAKIYQIFIEDVDELGGSPFRKTDGLGYGFDRFDDETLERMAEIWDGEIYRKKFKPGHLNYVLGCDANDNGRAVRIKKYIEHKSEYRIYVDVKCLSEEDITIEGCDGMIFLLSESSQNNSVMGQLFLRALDDGTRVFPLKTGEFELNDFYIKQLSHIQWKTCDRAFLDEIVDVALG